MSRQQSFKSGQPLVFPGKRKAPADHRTWRSCEDIGSFSDDDDENGTGNDIDAVVAGNLQSQPSQCSHASHASQATPPPFQIPSRSADNEPFSRVQYSPFMDAGGFDHNADETAAAAADEDDVVDSDDGLLVSSSPPLLPQHAHAGWRPRHFTQPDGPHGKPLARYESVQSSVDDNSNSGIDDAVVDGADSPGATSQDAEPQSPAFFVASTQDPQPIVCATPQGALAEIFAQVRANRRAGPLVTPQHGPHTSPMAVSSLAEPVGDYLSDHEDAPTTQTGAMPGIRSPGTATKAAAYTTPTAPMASALPLSVTDLLGQLSRDQPSIARPTTAHADAAGTKGKRPVRGGHAERLNRLVNAERSDRLRVKGTRELDSHTMLVRAEELRLDGALQPVVFMTLPKDVCSQMGLSVSSANVLCVRAPWREFYSAGLRSSVIVNPPFFETLAGPAALALGPSEILPLLRPAGPFAGLFLVTAGDGEGTNDMISPQPRDERRTRQLSPEFVSTTPLTPLAPLSLFSFRRGAGAPVTWSSDANITPLASLRPFQSAVAVRARVQLVVPMVSTEWETESMLPELRNGSRLLLQDAADTGPAWLDLPCCPPVEALAWAGAAIYIPGVHVKCVARREAIEALKDLSVVRTLPLDALVCIPVLSLASTASIETLPVSGPALDPTAAEILARLPAPSCEATMVRLTLAKALALPAGARAAVTVRVLYDTVFPGAGTKLRSLLVTDASTAAPVCIVVGAAACLPGGEFQPLTPPEGSLVCVLHGLRRLPNGDEFVLDAFSIVAALSPQPPIGALPLVSLPAFLPASTQAGELVVVNGIIDGVADCVGVGGQCPNCNSDALLHSLPPRHDRFECVDCHCVTDAPIVVGMLTLALRPLGTSPGEIQMHVMLMPATLQALVPLAQLCAGHVDSTAVAGRHFGPRVCHVRIALRPAATRPGYQVDGMSEHACSFFLLDETGINSTR